MASDETLFLRAHYSRRCVPRSVGNPARVDKRLASASNELPNISTSWSLNTWYRSRRLRTDRREVGYWLWSVQMVDVWCKRLKGSWWPDLGRSGPWSASQPRGTRAKAPSSPTTNHSRYCLFSIQLGVRRLYVLSVRQTGSASSQECSNGVWNPWTRRDRAALAGMPVSLDGIDMHWCNPRGYFRILGEGSTAPAPTEYPWRAVQIWRPLSCTIRRPILAWWAKSERMQRRLGKTSLGPTWSIEPNRSQYM